MNTSTDLIDFRELPSSFPGEGLEELVRHIGQRMDLSPSFSGRGPDGGRDLFFTEVVAGSVSRQRIKWLVSCKDKATSGQAVTEADLPHTGIEDKVRQHKADGFLLVTTTTPSIAAKALIDGQDKASGGRIYTYVWDKSELTRILLRPENNDLLKQFFPESYRKVKGLTSIEGALLALGDQLPPSVLDKVTRLVRPYSDVGMKGTQIWPYDATSARTIDEIVKSVVIENDYHQAVNATSNIEFDAFMTMLSQLYRQYPDESYKYIMALADGHDDPDLRYNAIQFAVDVYSRRIRNEDYYKLARALDDDSIEAVFGQIIAVFIGNELEENSYAYGIGDELDSISSATVVDSVSVPDLTVSRTKSGIEFKADLEFSLTLNAHDPEAAIRDSYPGTLNGNLDQSGFHITQASVDVSSFYE